MLQARGFVIQRSLLRVMVIWIIALAITPQTSSARVISLDQASYAHCVHAPPDVSSLTLEDAHVSSLEVITIIKRTLCSLIIHEQNYTRGQVIVLKYREYIFSYIKGIILKRPWVPHKI